MKIYTRRGGRQQSKDNVDSTLTITQGFMSMMNIVIIGAKKSISMTFETLLSPQTPTKKSN